MRINYWDNWKGIAIIAVVAIHASGSTERFQEGSFNWDFGLIIRQLINFAVPMFLAISGYFSAKSSDKDPISYYKNRLFKIASPYLFWTAIYIVLKTPSLPPSISEMLRGVFFGTGIGIGYFVIVLSQFIFLTPLFSKIRRKTTHILIIISASIIGLIFTYYFSIINKEHIFSNFPEYALPFFVWYPFYHAGYFLARYKDDIKINKSHTNKLIYCFALFISLSLIEGFFWAYNENYSFGVSQLKATSLTASFFLFLVALSLADEKKFLNRPLTISWFGKNSYAIYLIHILTLSVCQKILGLSEKLYSLQPVFVTLSTIASIAFCAIIIKTIRKALPTRLSKNILGN